MRRLLIMLCLVLVGCGGGGGSSTPNPIAGSWSGPWSDPGKAQQGTLKITVATDGNITGQILNTTLASTGTATGSIDGNGNISTTYTYVGSAPITATGTASIASNGHLTGVVAEHQNGNLIGNATINLVKQ